MTDEMLLDAMRTSSQVSKKSICRAQGSFVAGRLSPRNLKFGRTIKSIQFLRAGAGLLYGPEPSVLTCTFSTTLSTLLIGQPHQHLIAADMIRLVHRKQDRVGDNPLPGS